MDTDTRLVDDGENKAQLMMQTCISCKTPNTIDISPREYSHIKSQPTIHLKSLRKLMCDVCKEGQ